MIDDIVLDYAKLRTHDSRLPNISESALDLYLQQIPLDVADDNSGGVANEVVAASVTWKRVAHTVAPELATDVESLLVELSDAIDDGNLELANALATEFRDLLANM